MEKLLQRLEDLKKLKNGWYNDEGVGFVAKEIDWLKESIQRGWNKSDLFKVAIFPTVEGNIVFEWLIGDFGECDVSLEINLKKHVGWWHVLNFKKDSVFTCKVDFNNTKQWDWVTKQLKSLEV